LQEFAAIGRLSLAWIALVVIGMAWPVTVSADHGEGRHDGCQAATRADGDDCPVTAAAVPQPTAMPAPTPSPRPSTAPAVPTARPAPRPQVAPAGADLRISLLAAAALAALAALVVSGFGARHHLRHGWDD
jgi:hypothetical protein